LQYDQAGILFTFRPKTATSASIKWIKSGLEFYEGSPMLSTVACDRWADWSVTPLPSSESGDVITLQVEKAGDHHGTSFWVYYIGADQKKVPLREICWVYGDGDGSDVELEVSAYAARPESKASDKSLEVNYYELDVVWKS
jgi:uncharacterized protein